MFNAIKNLLFAIVVTYAVIVTISHKYASNQYAQFAEKEISKLQWVEVVDCTPLFLNRIMQCEVSTTSWSVSWLVEQVSCAN